MYGSENYTLKLFASERIEEEKICLHYYQSDTNQGVNYIILVSDQSNCINGQIMNFSVVADNFKIRTLIVCISFQWAWPWMSWMFWFFYFKLKLKLLSDGFNPKGLRYGFPLSVLNSLWCWKRQNDLWARIKNHRFPPIIIYLSREVLVCLISTVWQNGHHVLQ